MATSFSAVTAAQIPGLEPEKKWDLSGYIKYMATYSHADDDSDSLDHLVHQRFNYEYRFDNGLSFNAALRNRALAGDSLNIPYYGDYVAFDNGYFDLSKNLTDSSDLIINSQLDRLYLDWQGQDWRARAGRFRVNWGINNVWNPNDLFNAYSIYDFDYEERPGTDALMMGRKLGYAGGADVIFNPNTNSHLNSYAGRYYNNKQGWDYQVITGKSLNDYVLGAGFATDVSGAGIRGEITGFKPREMNYQGVEQQQTVVMSLDADYSFGGTRNWMARAAWLYISHPLDVSSAQAYLNLPLSAKTLSFTKNTGYADVSFDLTPLNRITLSASYYQDNSYFVGLSNSYSLANDWQLLAVLQRFDGSDNSLFSETPATLLFVNIKWSF
ncbi:hypothetical protein TW81_03855 [Vibrio galatheae]|uniref:Alginate export domain-containing protein n=1 Tax=Vibrio galatheae TaxID=579748 RepID=A0A0F4NRG9_9VIBR|nr:hypothetical protein TW81_03855 [Vibrio galatheae]